MAALEAHHYLGAPDSRQCLLGQVAKLGEQAVGILVWTHAARTLRAREQFVGWDARTRQKRLGYVVQNNRFLVLSEVRQPNLASRILGLAAQALPAQWEEGFGIRPMLAEIPPLPAGGRRLHRVLLQGGSRRLLPSHHSKIEPPTAS